MRIIGVIDVLDAVAVAARAGNRALYQPLQSPLCDDSAPDSVASAFARKFNVREIYLADLDGLSGRPANHAPWKAVAAVAERLWIDTGIRGPQHLAEVQEQLAALPIHNASLICASESWQADSFQMPADTVCGSNGANSVAFSVDLRDGKIVHAGKNGHDIKPIDFITRLVADGWQRLIILDVTAVGIGRGCPTVELCAATRRLSPHIEIITGGGIRNTIDLKRVEDAGCDAALVSTALHAQTLARPSLTPTANEPTQAS